MLDAPAHLCHTTVMDGKRKKRGRELDRVALRRYRHAAGLTLMQVAKRLGVTERTVRYWETLDPAHRCTPSGPRLLDLAALYGVSVDRLVR